MNVFNSFLARKMIVIMDTEQVMQSREEEGAQPMLAENRKRQKSRLEVGRCSENRGDMEKDMELAGVGRWGGQETLV